MKKYYISAIVAFLLGMLIFAFANSMNSSEYEGILISPDRKLVPVKFEITSEEIRLSSRKITKFAVTEAGSYDDRDSIFQVRAVSPEGYPVSLGLKWIGRHSYFGVFFYGDISSEVYLEEK